MNKRIDLLGYPVDNLTTPEIIEKIRHAIQAQSKLKIIAINANKIYQARTDAHMERILKQSDIVIPEYAFVWASKILGTPLVEHVGGIMLMRSLLEAPADQNFSFYFLGAKPEIVEQMISNIRKSYPHITIAGWHHGYFEDEKMIVHQVNRSAASILFVAMGVPGQEYFIHRNHDTLKVPVVLGVGGSFDVFAGARRETPSYLRHGFEWLYRLAQDPHNLWKRYLTTNPYFVYQVLKYKIFKNSSAGKCPETIDSINQAA